MFCRGFVDVVYVGKKNGVTKDGVAYASIDVLDRQNRKFNFISTKPELIDFLNKTSITQFRMIRVILSFDREFNKEKRTSYWSCELEDIQLEPNK